MYNLQSLELSHSSRQMFASCARKLEFRKFYASSKRDETLASSVGTALHEGLQTWLDTGDKQAAIWAMMVNYPIKFVPPSPQMSRSLEACYATLIAMMSSQALNGYELVRVNVNGELRPAVEVPFVIHVTNFDFRGTDGQQIPIRYVGFIDLIMYNIITDEYVIIDIKTTGRKLDDFTPVYRFDDQCLPYALVLDRLIGRPVTELNYKILSCFIDLDEPKVKLLDFHKSADEIADWTRGLYLDLQLIKTYYESAWFPRRSTACTAFNRTCQFFDFCQTRDEKTINTLLDFQDGKTEERKLPAPWIEVDLSFG